MLKSITEIGFALSLLAVVGLAMIGFVDVNTAAYAVAAGLTFCAVPGVLLSLPALLFRENPRRRQALFAFVLACVVSLYLPTVMLPYLQ